MIRYNVRSRYLVDLLNEIRAGKLVLAPFFQRKLVWREAHKTDFIDTILLQFPFPEIFLARGEIDVDQMTSTSAVVDGQQRLNAIREFVDGTLAVNGRHYGDLSSAEKEAFLKYEVAIIDLDLPQSDPQIIEIFKRLNRTFYALSTIEKQATEYASSEFMLLAKLLCGELKKSDESKNNVDPTVADADPNITPEYVSWANKQSISAFKAIILESRVFSKYEVSRMVPLAFTLNVMATTIFGYYNRNEKVAEYLELYKEELPEKEDLIRKLNSSASIARRLRVLTSSFWSSKSNAFTLLTTLATMDLSLENANREKLAATLKAFAADPPADYALAAREGVNNRPERLLRHNYVRKLIEEAFA